MDGKRPLEQQSMEEEEAIRAAEHNQSSKRRRKPAASASPNSHDPWTDLSQELIEQILGHLAFPDQVRCGAVCTSWRSVVIRNPLHQALRFPWMICLSHPSSQISIAPIPGDDDKVHVLHIPLPHLGYCLGSYRDWLVMADGESDTSTILLVNPFSGHQILLPSKLRCPEQTTIGPWYTFNLAILSSAPTPAGDCVVVALNRSSQLLAFCRPGADEWVRVMAVQENLTNLVDVKFHEGKLYGLNNFQLMVFEINYPDVEVVGVHRLAEPFSLQNCIGCMYLMGGAGKLFMVFKQLEFQIGNHRLLITVFELHPEGTQWVKVMSLDDLAIFLAPPNFSRSIVIADNSPGYSRGCIYLMGKNITTNRSSLFCIEDGSGRELLDGNKPSDCSLFWFLLRG